MKTIYNKVQAILLLLAPCSLLLLYGCSDFLETPSKSALQTDDMYTTPAKVDQALIGVYGCLKPFATYYFIMSENRSDNFFETSEGSSNDYADCAQFNTSRLVNDNIVNNCWCDHYTLIAAANALIERQGDAQGMSQETRVQYEAEARFLRALSYFDLVRFFGRVPLSLKELTTDEAFTLPQSEPIEIYEKGIIPDLEYAIEHLTDVAVDYNGVKHSERATKIAAQALLGKVYMQMAGWPLQQDTEVKAQKLLKEVIDAWDKTNKWAKDYNEWNQMWVHENDNKYFIFEIQYIAEKNQGNPAAPLAKGQSYTDDNYCGAYLTTGKHIYMERELQAKLVEGYDATTKDMSGIIDKRVYNTINVARWLDEETGTETGGDPNKDCFPTRFFEHKMKRDSLGYGNMDASIVDASYWPQNWPVLRIEDIMLLYAESVGVRDGIEYFNKVHTRAGRSALPKTVSEDTFQEYVTLERRIELFAEGHRWFDQVRKNTFVKDIQRKMDYYPTTDSRIDASIYVAFKNRVTQSGAYYPIPQRQIRNSGGLYKQNPGYSN